MSKYRVVCFGDSNTWGHNPVDCSRFPEGVRWTSILQELLGEEYTIIEEGQCGRNISTDDPAEGEKNGLKHIIPVMESQGPFNLLVIMLGTNDTKRKFGYSAEDISNCMQIFLEKVLSHIHFRMQDKVKVLLVSPAPMNETICESYFADMFGYENCIRLSKRMPKMYENLAKMYGTEFFDAALVTEASHVDGLHLNEEGHKKLAIGLAEKIKEISGIS